jgi:hypothetical protein
MNAHDQAGYRESAGGAVLQWAQVDLDDVQARVDDPVPAARARPLTAA